MSVKSSTFLSHRANPRRYLTRSLAGFIFLISCSEPVTTDVFIAGGGTSGVAAGLQAARMGVSTVIAEEYDWMERPILRTEAAILIDRALYPFNSLKVTLKGLYLIP